MPDGIAGLGEGEAAGRGGLTARLPDRRLAGHSPVRRFADRTPVRRFAGHSPVPDVHPRSRPFVGRGVPRAAARGYGRGMRIILLALITACASCPAAQRRTPRDHEPDAPQPADVAPRRSRAAEARALRLHGPPGLLRRHARRCRGARPRAEAVRGHARQEPQPRRGAGLARRRARRALARGVPGR